MCAPGTSSCVEGVPSTCNAAGTASVAQAPCEGNEICSDGACVVEVIDEDVVDGDVPILDTFQAECVEDDDCNKTLTLDTCERASCNEGVCEALLKEDGTECADGLCVEGECLEITCPAGEVLCGDGKTSATAKSFCDQRFRGF